MSASDDSGSDTNLGCSPSSDHAFPHSSDLFRAVLNDTLKMPRRDLAKHVGLASDDYDSGCNTPLGTSPSQHTCAKGSELFKNAFNDCMLDESDMHVSKYELERYKTSKLQNRDCEKHTVSRRCDTCRQVLTHCKCDSNEAKDRKHRVHWADEIWNEPLTTNVPYVELKSINDDVPVPSAPKPILKHRATCVIIVSE